MNLKKLLLLCSCICALSLVGCNGSQDGSDEEKSNPVPAFVEHEITVSAAGGEVSVGYTVENHVDNADITVKSDAAWIVSCAATDGLVTFMVKKNEAIQDRSAEVQIRYECDGVVFADTAVVLQKGIEVEEMKYMSCTYDGFTGNGVTRWIARLSETSDFKEYYSICFVVRMDAEPDYDNLVLPEGTYSLPRTLFEGGTNFVGKENKVFTDAEVKVVHYEGGYELDCKFTTSKWEKLLVHYNGPCKIVDNSSLSTISEDINSALEDHEAVASFWGDMEGTGTSNWYITIDPQSGDGDGLQLDLYVDPSKGFEDGLPAGTFESASTSATGTYFTGSVRGGYLYGTWYLQYRNGSLSGHAPCISGPVTVSKDGDIYTIAVDCVDDSHKTPRKIQLTWSGKLDMVNKAGNSQ